MLSVKGITESVTVYYFSFQPKAWRLLRFQIGEIMFKKTTPDGKVDPNINIAGRKPVDSDGNKVLTNRELSLKSCLVSFVK